MDSMHAINPLLLEANNAFKHKIATACHCMQERDGLPHMAIRPFADIEWETLPHVELTKKANGTHDLWLPASLDHEHPTMLESTTALTPDPTHC